MPTADQARPPASEFVPADIDATDFANLEPLYRALIDREIGSAGEFERWLADRSELQAAVSEAGAQLYITMTCFTEDQEAQGAYASFVESVPPKIKPLAFELDKKHAELAERFNLPRQRYEVIDRDTIASVELFREESIPLQTELDRLSQKADQVAGVMTVEFEGEERTLPQMGKILESNDRARREGAWRAVWERRLKERDAFDEIYDKMIKLRHQVARNAGFDDYVGYAFKAMSRFDYTPADCAEFHDACAEHVVPLVRELDAQRAETMGVSPLRPWDTAVDAKGRPPLQPFEDGQDLVEKTRTVMRRIDPRLETMFSTLGDNSADGARHGACLDLDSRKGKAPGGYQYQRDRSRTPFIFMNAAGVHRDVETMVHEAGHAFHSLLSDNEPLLHYRHAPIEFAEVASMSMELLSMGHWGGEGGFYPDEQDHQRAMRQQLSGSISALPWIAQIDAFQHWIYANPTHTREQRTASWLELDRRFGHDVSWDGLDSQRQTSWQRQMHLFGVPFYYIEYGIAQLGAFQLWLRALEEGESVAISAYMKALSLGGSRPLPELFEAGGLEFDFGADTVKRLVDRVRAELDKLPV